MAKTDDDLSLKIGFDPNTEALEAEIEKAVGKGIAKGIANIRNEAKRQNLTSIISDAGGNFDRFNAAAAYHSGTEAPIQLRGKGGLSAHTGNVSSSVITQIQRENEATYAKFTGSKQYNATVAKNIPGIIGSDERDDIIAAATLHDRFKYTNSGKLNPNAMKDAAQWAKIFNYEEAANILSDPNSRGARIISAIDFAASRESRWADMDENGAWKKQDFDVLDAAVKSGEGRWKNPDSAHTVDNFEAINDATQEENENLEDWRDNLKGIIGDLGIIALLMKGMKAVMKFDKWAEQTVQSGAEGSPTRSNIGATTTDLYRMQTASKYLNLDRNAIYDSVSALAERQGEFATTGQGLELFYGSVAQGLEPILKNMNDPIEAWNQSMDLFLKELTALKEAGNQQGIDKLLNSIEKFMGGNAKTILSKMLDFNFDSQTSNDIKSVSALYDKTYDNPYAGELDRTEAINSELNVLRESIRKSYEAIATDWEVYFGRPFKSFWNKFLIAFIDWYRSNFDAEEFIETVAHIKTDEGRNAFDDALYLSKKIEQSAYGAFTAEDLRNTAGGAKHTNIVDYEVAKRVYDALPDYMKAILTEGSSTGKIDLHDSDTWNLLMAAEKIKNSTENSGQYKQSTRENSLRAAMTKAGLVRNGFYGWLADKYKEAGVINDHTFTLEDKELLSEYFGAHDTDLEKEANEYLKTRFSGKGVDTGKFGTYEHGYNDFKAAVATRFNTNYMNDEAYRKTFTTEGMYAARELLKNTMPGMSVDVTRYLQNRLRGADDVWKRLQDETVTNYEKSFVNRMTGVITDTSLSDAQKYELIDELIDMLRVRYLNDYGPEIKNDSVFKDYGKDEPYVIPAEGSKTSKAPTINITVNGVDTNNANEVAYAVSSELKPALAAQTDSVV